MKLWMVIVGAILLVLGGALALIFMSPGDTQSIKDVQKDIENGKMNVGDTVIIEGEITDEEKMDLLGMTLYAYELDNSDYGVFASGDIGNKGDDVCVKVELTEMGLEVKEELGTPPIFYIGIVLAIIGLILLIIGLILKGKKAKEAAAQPATVPPQEPQGPAPGSYEALYGSPAPAGHDQVQAPPPQQQQPGYGAPPRQHDEY